MRGHSRMAAMMNKSLASKINTWQAGGSPVFVSSIPSAEFTGGFGSIPTSAGSRTTPYTVMTRAHAIRENCNITGCSVLVYYLAPPGGQEWKYKLFRWSVAASAYECIASSSIYPVGSGVVNNTQNFTFETPIPAQEGDIEGLYIPLKCAIINGPNYTKPGVGKANPLTGCIDTDIAVGETNAFAQTITDLFGAGGVSDYSYPCVCSYGHRPYAVFLGDSIVSSGNTSTPLVDGEKWQTDQENVDCYHTPGGSPGNINFSVAYRLSTRMPASFTYQVFSQSGSQFADMVGLQDDRAVATDPKIVIVHCGYNDLFVGSKSWAQISANLDTLKTTLTGRIVYLDEVLPLPSGSSDAAAVAIRALNANYATYCAANGWTLIRCHDEMGQVRVSTGEKDDLTPAYSNGDSVHLSLAGVDKLAEIIRRYIS